MIYLIDTNVFKHIGPSGDANVRAWFASVDDHQIRISAITVLECQKGLTKAARTNATSAAQGQVQLDAILAAWKNQIIPIGHQEAKLWGELLGAKEKNKNDVGLVATAKLHGWTLATRNIQDCTGYGVRLLDPFKKPPRIIEPA